MQTLFASTDPVTPDIPGLRYEPDFLTLAEEKRLLALIDAAPWDTHWQRRIQPYGGTYGDARGTPIPDWGRALARRLHRDGFTPFLCDQMLVNEYLPGQGIAPHVDYGDYDRCIVSISLRSACIMDLVHVDGRERHGIWLERRSVLILDGEARSRWKHGIAARKKDSWNGAWFPRGRRVSVTFRRVQRAEPLHAASPAPPLAR